MKTLENSNLVNGQFEFELLDSNRRVIQTATNYQDGRILFEEIEFTSSGSYQYFIREKIGNDSQIEYDRSEHTVVVQVEEVDGRLIAIADYNTDPHFNNVYVPNSNAAVIMAQKVLENGLLQNNQFEFELLDQNGNILQTTTNDSEGNIIFEELVFDREGSFRYELREKNTNVSQIKYDDSIIEVSVEIFLENGQLSAGVNYESEAIFINEQLDQSTPEEEMVTSSPKQTGSASNVTRSNNLPNTGTMSPNRMITIVGLLLIALTFIILVLKKMVTQQIKQNSRSRRK